MQTDDRISIQTDIPQVYDLGFCTISLLSQHIAEVVVNPGLDVTLDMVEHFHTFLLSHLSAPIYLLVDKVHSYSYTFEAQRELATIPEIQAMAVVSYNSMADIATQALAALPRKVQWNLKIFSSKDDALDWLTSLQMSQRPQVG